MKNSSYKIASIISYFFAFLFIYTSVSKILDFEKFQVQISQSPILSPYSHFISYGVIITELVIVGLLITSKIMRMGLLAFCGIMSAFTMYIYLILNYTGSVPCSCGGIIESMSWDQHLTFNIACIILAVVAIVITFKKNISSISVIKLLLMITISCFLVIILFYPLIRKAEGNFKRKTISLFLKEERQLELPADNFYFAGNNGDTLFLANRKTPLLLKTIEPKFDLIKTDTIKLNHYNHNFISVTINIMYPYFSVYDGKVPVIYEGKLPLLNAYDTGINRLYFSRLYLLAPQKYLFKTMLVKTNASELGILNSATQKYAIIDEILQSKQNNVFDTDGNISIDYKGQNILYTHLYHSEIISTDFNLKNIHRNKTLDSFSQADIKTKTLKNGQTKLITVPQEINKIQSISNQKLYNVSKIRGRDESYSDQRNNDFVDVYNLCTKQYLYSFRIKNENRIKIKSILVTRKYLYVLSGNQITRYTLK